jgi:hypothetical protein
MESSGKWPMGPHGDAFEGIPDPRRPLLVATADFPSLIGQSFESELFRISPIAHSNFLKGTFLSSVYRSPLGSESLIEGFYLLALLDPLVAGLVRNSEGHETALNYGTNRVRFLSPVHESDLLRLQCRIISVAAKESGCLVGWDGSLELVPQARPAMHAEWLVLYPTPREEGNRE